jgi:hypothetical protein
MNMREYLEEQMDLKKLVSIRFRAVDGGVSEIRGHIVKVWETAGREMFETDAGLLIGVDQVVELNGRQSENYC